MSKKNYSKIVKKLGIKEVELDVDKHVRLSATTSGVLCKTVAEVDGRQYYLKTGKQKGMGFDTAFPASEMIAYDLGRVMGFPVASYELWCVDASLFLDSYELEEYQNEIGILECVDLQKGLRSQSKVLINASENFLQKGEILHHAASLDLRDLDGKALYESLNASGRFSEGFIDKMILFDFIICGVDRHHTNFGYILTSDGKYKSAPLYDHGDSLFSRYDTYFISQWGTDLGNRVTPKPFDSIAKPLSWINPEQVNKLNLNITRKDIERIVLRYEPLLGDPRCKTITELIIGRLAYARGILSGVV
jgi:hypothetical protein